MPDMKIQQISFDTEVEHFLIRANLLADDIPGNDNIRLYGVRSAQKLSGLVGLEGFGSVALLRSLAVSKRARNHGLGRSLVNHAEQQAAQTGVLSLYLLTTTESQFFERLGYVMSGRESVPDAIAVTAQFSQLCPASACLMCKQLEA